VRLLFLSERYPPDLGGVATSSGRISRVLAGLGVEVDVVSWTRMLQPGIVEEVTPGVYRIGRFREWDSTLPHTMNLIDWLTSRNPYDAIWGHYLSPAGFLATFVGQMKAVPSTVSVRGNDLDRDMFPPGDFARLEWTLRHATVVTAVTQELARKVKALTAREDVVHLRNAVDVETFRPVEPDAGLRRRLGIRDGELVLGFAGELREKKGLQFLLRALREIRAQRPACLLVIGEVRPSDVMRLMQSLEAGSLEENRVLVTGQLATPAEVNEHLQLCDVYLQPSLWDGMPNALLEAMAAGCRCIGSDAGGIPEIIRSDADGLVLPRWELHRLGDAVLRYLDRNPQPRERILAEFTSEREREDLRRVLEVLRSRR
jgi:glycosyltransferase involved in cell wall biosynthesis